jgi:hypothetical protein
VDDRLFRRWNPASLTVYWARLCTRAKVQDLHFHDLRHTFTTGLQNLGVPLKVRAALLWHTIRGMGTDALGGVAMTSQYSHGGYGWNQQLREAVMRLESGFLVYEMVYGLVRTNRRLAVNAAKAQGKKWWSQRDSNVFEALRGLTKARKINDLCFIDLPIDSKIFQRVPTCVVYIDHCLLQLQYQAGVQPRRSTRRERWSFEES